jgi:histidinol-phosphate aminotransferase
MDLQELLRDNIRRLQPYSSARDEFKGKASVYLDANENPYNAPFNRYPDPLQQEVKQAVALLKNAIPGRIFFGNGSDEPIDLLYRAFCEPRIDNAVAIEPTYGMYKVCADVNDVEYRKVMLDGDFRFSAEKMLNASDEHTKIIWLCSPNNPTGNSLQTGEIEILLNKSKCIVVIDEAYIDFSQQKSFISDLEKYPNLVVLQTLSKAWAHAAVRFGMAFASEEIIAVLNKIKYPYNINILTQKQVLEALRNADKVKEWVGILLEERTKLIDALKTLPLIERVYPTDANFVLVKVADANRIYNELVEKEIIVRNRNSVALCAGCLRITVGSPEENRRLVEALTTLPPRTI